jgi:hypothetical protein
MHIFELLNELADSPERFELVSQDDDVWEVSADSLGLYLYFTRGLGPDSKHDQVYIEFAVNGRYDLTKGGNAIKVLSTVIAMIKSYLPKFVKKQDNYISFGADKAEPSRVSLYKRAVPILSRILSTMDYNWKYQNAGPSSGSLETYTWTRTTQ